MHVLTRDYKYIRPPKDDIYFVYLESRTGLLLYEFCTVCTVLPSYYSAKLTNFTAISRIFMSHWFSSTPPSDVHTHSPSSPNPVAISKGEDEK